MENEVNKTQEQLGEQEVETNPVDTKESEVKENGNDTPITYTEEDLKSKIQSETDRVRTEYTRKIKKLEGRIAELEPKELSPAELEMKKRLDELEQKQAEVEAKEELLNLQTSLTEMNLPKSLVTYLNGNIDVGEFAKVIDAIVIERNKSAGYQPTPHTNSDGMTREKWKKLPYSQKVELYNTNPDLYSKFMK